MKIMNTLVRMAVLSSLVLSVVMATPTQAAFDLRPNSPANGAGILLEGHPREQGEVVAYHPLTGMARFMGAQSGAPIKKATALMSNATPEKAATSFLEVRGREFGLADPAKDLKVLLKTQIDNGASAVRFQQTYHGVPILAGEMIVHMDSANNVLSASGDILPNIELDTTPMVDEATSIQTALVATALENGVSIEGLQTSVPELWIYNPVLLTPYNGETVLVWRIEVTPKNSLGPIRQLVLVDAQHGDIVLSTNQIAEIMDRKTYDAAGTAAIPGTLACDESNPTCAGGTPDAIKAHEYAGDVYDFYMTNHGRDSIDGAGMSIISTTNTSTFPTARWTGSQMIYAAGWVADDVVAHELTHGVTDYTSDLFLLWQAGAINESFSDIWGEFVDLTNGSGTDTPAVRWKIAEDAPGGAVRDMNNPALFSNPDKMTSPFYYTGASEAVGVHVNSGVNNKAVALMVDGGTFNGQTITGLGITKVAKIYYYVQTNLLTSGADYADLYYALQASCAAQIGIAGITPADCQEVLDAITAVEMNLQPLLPAGGYNPDVAACDVAGELPFNSFYDDMESGPANWISGAAVGANHWTYDWPYEATLGIFAHSGDHFLFADILPVQVADTTIQMANSVIVPANGKMIFHHAYATGAGSVLEYSTTDGASWIDAGSLMDGNGYDMTLSNATNPLNGRQVFFGISHGYISTRLDLSSLAGQNIMFRFRFGMGSSNSGGYGWWLDDVQIYECQPAPSIVSSVLANSNPTPASSVDFTVTFSKPVTGVDNVGPAFDDFALTTSGVSGAAVSGVSGTGSSYTVTVSTGTGNGTIRLDVPVSATITDLSSNPLSGLPFTSGETYDIEKTIITTFKSTGAQDGFILESTETSGVGGTMNATASTLNLGDDAAKRQYRSILSFNTATLPDNAIVTKVTLKLKRQGVVGGGNPVGMFQGFVTDIKKGMFGTAPLALGDFNATASKTVGPSSPALTAGWYNLNLTPAKTFINKLGTGGGLTQIRLRFKLDDNNNAVANFLKIYSGNAGAVNRPQLVIEYYVP
ncbi:MAG: M4 family metallopeptidase [Chloroflexi bacterium]|nr:M4 family metallopeptidase [Chloroflexota bacterium]